MLRRTRSAWCVPPLMLALACQDADRKPTYDPATMDQTVADLVYPPAMVELAFESSGHRLNGLIYLAQGAGPHPTVILLHGYPGNERNLDLAQAVRRAGANVLYFNYRGTWGSAGLFSVQNAIDDVEAALTFVRSGDARSAYRVDSTRLALVGHSFGGFAAAMGVANDSRVRCLGFLAGANLGILGKAVAADPATAQAVREGLGVAMHPTAGPVRGDLDAALVELADRAEEFDLIERASSLGDRPVLLVAGTNDVLSVKAEMHDPLVAALRAVDAQAVTEVLFESDHYFSGHRIALARALVEWLSTRCWPN